MFKVLFAELSTGRLQRLPFLGYQFLLWGLMLAVVVGIVVTIGIAEQLIGGDLQQAQEQLRQHFGVITLLLVMGFYLVLLLASLNLFAKRFRDIGMWGWLATIVCIVVAALLSGLASEEVSNGFSGLVWLVLLLVPGGIFTAATREA